jgi:hypothetical protein
VFNTQLGILFWTMTGALFGTAKGWQIRSSSEDEEMTLGADQAEFELPT